MDFFFFLITTKLFNHLYFCLNLKLIFQILLAIVCTKTKGIKPQCLICSHNLMKNIQDLNRESYICCWEQVEKMATFWTFEWENFTTPMQSAFQSTPSHCWLYYLSFHPDFKAKTEFLSSSWWSHTSHLYDVSFLNMNSGCLKILFHQAGVAYIHTALWQFHLYFIMKCSRYWKMDNLNLFSFKTFHKALVKKNWQVWESCNVYICQLSTRSWGAAIHYT